MIVGLTVLSACAPRASVPPLYRRLDGRIKDVDRHEANALISGHRRNNGLTPLALDEALTRLAADRAAEMAASGDAQPAAALPIEAAMREAHIDFVSVRENASAGYRTLAEAFSGWRESPTHNAVMLTPEATRLGIATFYKSGSKYRVFWSMIVANRP